MKKTSLFILLLFCALSVFSQKQNPTRKLSNTEKILGLSRLWEGVRNNFVYYDHLKFNWDSLYSASIQKVLDTKDSYSYIKELERIVASVKDGHTYIIHDVTPDLKDIIKPAPFTTKFIDGKVFVDKVWSSDFISKGVKRGVEVTAINGIDVIKYGEEVLVQYIPSSTTQWLDYKVFNRYELTKGKRTIHVNVEFYDGEKKFSIDVDRDKNWDIQQKERKSHQTETDDYSSLKYSKLDNNIGLLTISDFMNDSFTQLFDSLYSEILQSKALIIDLRDNGGGRSNYADYILTHLSSKPIKTSSWSSRMYIPAHASWNYPPEWFSSPSEYLTPVENKKIYDKPIVVLVNAGTFSSSEDFCVKFRGMKRGKLMGTTTGGSTGNGVLITLIEGIASANICSKKDISPDGVAFVGVGVIPDIEAKETKQSFIDKKDIILEKALLELLKN
ncbi:MAG: peptidase S41 [Bacteroidetes bacterium]|nr:peptidase S41 [Bacteroidota bacterium]